MKKAIIFCQAPIELPNVINLYETLRGEGKEVTIVALRAYSYVEFIHFLDIKVKVVFWKEIKIGIKHLSNFFKLKRQIKKNLSQIDIKDSEVFFTSRFDIQLALYFKYFKQSIKVTYTEGMDKIWVHKSSNKLRLKNRVNYLLMKIAASVPIKCFQNGDYKFLPEIDIRNIGDINLMKFKDDSFIIKKYSYAVGGGQKKKYIIFTEPYRNKFQSEDNYISLNVDLVKYLKKKDIYVVMKGHPRIGYLPELESLVDEVIPSYIPSEFIDYNDFEKAFGFVTTAICDSSNYIPSYSLLKMCEITNQDEYNYWCSFVDRIGEQRVVYLESFEDVL